MKPIKTFGITGCAGLPVSRDLNCTCSDIRESSLHPKIDLELIRKISKTADLPPTKDPLMDREEAVMKLVAQGLHYQEIAETLFISGRTVGNHIGTILNKLHLAKRTQVALYALRKVQDNLDEE